MLSKWARKLHQPGTSPGSESSSSSAPENRLPFLPSERPRRPLTPPSSPSFAPAQSSPAGAAPHEPALFFRLPFDIRRRILVEAFGDRTIHIDLVYGRPRDLPRDSPNEKHRFRRAPRPTERELRSSPALHKLKPKRWRWHSCVCHSVLPFKTNTWSRIAEPCNDSCADTVNFCEQWPSEAPSKCQIGIMGWLLTCRQA